MGNCLRSNIEIEYIKLREEERLKRFLDGTRWFSDSIHDKRLKTLRYRPDFLKVFKDKVIVIECDEYEHSRRGYEVSKETERMFLIASEMYEEHKLPTYFIRYNPHNCKFKGRRVKIHRKDKQIELKTLTKELIKQKVSERFHFASYYINYSNPNKWYFNKKLKKSKNKRRK